MKHKLKILYNYKAFFRQTSGNVNFVESRKLGLHTTFCGFATVAEIGTEFARLD